MKLVHFFFFILASIGLNAQDYFWVGNSGNWSDLSHWATSSGGATFHNALPGPENDVYFDENSFTEAGATVTIDIDEAICGKLDASGAINDPSIEGVGFCDQLHVHGDLIIPANVGRALKCVFLSGEGDHIVQLGAVNCGNSSFLRHSSGNYVLQDSLSVTNLYIEANEGSFDTQGLPINAPARVRTYNGNSAVFDATGSRIYTSEFTMHPTNTLLFENTEIYISGSSNWNFQGGGVQYPFVQFNGNHRIIEDVFIDELIILPGSEINLLPGITVSSNQFTINGTSLEQIGISSDSPGSEAFFSQSEGSVESNWLILQDIHAIGGAEFNALNSVDNGNNDGWNISEPVPQDYFWVGGSGSWSDVSHWATTSGGSEFHAIPPTLVDDVYFDENSFLSSEDTVMLDGNFQVGSLSGVNALGAILMSTEENEILTVSNDFLGGNLVYDVYIIDLNTSSSAILEQGNADLSQSTIRIVGGGMINLSDSVSVQAMLLPNGSLITNGNPLRSENALTFNGGPSTSLDISGSTLYLGVWNFNSNTASLITDNSTIRVEGNFLASNAGDVYHDVVFTDNGFISGTAPIFNTLTIEAQADLNINNGIVVTIDDLIANGTAEDRIEIYCQVEGGQGTFFKESGEVNVSFVELTDNQATGGAVFNAINSVDNGNVIGWNIESLEPSDYYWVGGSGSWNDISHWATTSGGSEFHEVPPSQLDNVFFDTNSFQSADDIVSLNDLSLAGNIDATEAIAGATIESISNASLEVYGDLSGGELNWAISLLRFENSFEVNWNSISGSFDNSFVRIDGSGAVNLQDSVSIGTLIVDNGSFISSAQPINILSDFIIDDSFTPTVDLSGGNVYVNNWEAANEEATYLLENTVFFVTGEFLSGEGIAYEEVNFIAPGTIAGHSSFASISIAPDASLGIDIGSILSIDQLIANGSEDDLIEIYCTTPGGTGTFSKEEGEILVSYVDLQDNHAIGGATFTAFESSEGSNVEGWNFDFESSVQNDPSDNLKIYPNPGNGIIWVDSKGEVTAIQIYDSNGRYVSAASPLTNELVFDCNNLPSGLYVLQIVLGDGSSVQRRYLKE